MRDAWIVGHVCHPSIESPTNTPIPVSPAPNTSISPSLSNGECEQSFCVLHGGAETI